MAPIALYLLDTDVLIAAKNLYYQMDRVPQFWLWILYQASYGRIKIPTKVIDEIRRGTDELSQWVKSNRVTLELDEELDAQAWSGTLTKGYGYSKAQAAQQDLVEQRADPFQYHLLASYVTRRYFFLVSST